MRHWSEWRADRLRKRDHEPMVSIRFVIVRFAAGTLVAILVALVGGYFVLRSVAIDEATDR